MGFIMVEFNCSHHRCSAEVRRLWQDVQDGELPENAPADAQQREAAQMFGLQRRLQSQRQTKTARGDPRSQQTLQVPVQNGDRWVGGLSYLTPTGYS